MKLRTFERSMALVACLGMILPTAALAEQAPQQAVGGIDIALAQGGLFTGQVVDAQGAPQANAEVAVLYQGREVVRSMTDENGTFAAQGLRGGQYEIVTQGHVVPVRLWADRTAPPASRSRALIVTGADVVNGQYGGSLGRGNGVLSWMQAHPFIVAGAVVTAIAVPLAVASDDDDNNTSS